MIVVPRTLSELLAAADDPHRKALALDFADHAAARAMGSDVPDESIAYLRSARLFLNGELAIVALAESYRRFYQSLGRKGAGRDVGSLVMAAAEAACGRELEQHGASAGLTKHGPDVLSVARDAQKVVARWSSEDGSPESRTWEEARWQLQHVISTAPNPHETAGGR